MLHFLSFGDSKSYQNHLQRIKKEAQKFSLIDSLQCLTEKDLAPDFHQKHKAFLIKTPRGFGCFIWKPYIILQKLNEIEFGDILFYCDAGCHLSTKGKKRFADYLKLTENNDALFFDIQHEIKKFTKVDLLESLDSSFKHRGKSQVAGGIFFLKKSKRTLLLVERWYSVASNYHLIDDSPSLKEELPEFIAHRHDQSILSLLIRGANWPCIIKDETYFDNFFKDSRESPILAVRRDTLLMWALQFPYPLNKLIYKTVLRLKILPFLKFIKSIIN